MKKVGLIFIFLLLLIPSKVYALTWQEYNEAVANVSISAATTYSDDFVYTYRWAGTPDNPIDKMDQLNHWQSQLYKGIKSESGSTYGPTKATAGVKGGFANKFPVYCGSFVHGMIYHASGGKVSLSDYDKIDANQLVRGDVIQFQNHIAIFLDNANDNDDTTWTVAEASSKIRVTVTTRLPSVYGYRIKSSGLAKLDYNTVTASYDFHDRLDDYPPVIGTVTEIENTNRIQIFATDYKHYDLSKQSDVLEPESNGIVAYKVSTSPVTPTTDWKNVNKGTILNVQEEVEGNGTYYIYVKDVGGNVTSKTVNLTKIYVDKELPTLGEFSFESSEDSVKVTITGATDNKGIKEYRYYLDGQLINSSSSGEYLITNLSVGKVYEFYYEVVDTSNNAVKSMVYEIEAEMDADSIEVPDKELYLIKGSTYKFEPQVEVKNNKYKIKYRSSDETIVEVSQTGEINCISTGKATITISVGRTKIDVKVTVSPYNIVFDVNELPDAYIGEEYSIKIVTTPQSEISIINSTLPNGLRIVNNEITGIPLENSSGEYELTLLAKNNEAETTKKYVFYVKYNIEIKNNELSKAYLNKDYSELIEINYPATISIINGNLPDGLYVANNKIQGTPTESGEFKFTVKVDYKNSTNEKDYTLVVSKYTMYDYLIFAAILVVVIIFVLMINNTLKNKKVKKK